LHLFAARKLPQRPLINIDIYEMSSCLNLIGGEMLDTSTNIAGVLDTSNDLSSHVAG
jgi:hypothetical protein